MAEELIEDSYETGDSYDNVPCPYCKKDVFVGDREIYDDDKETECDHCGRVFKCWGEQSYTYYSKKIEGQE